MKPERDYRKAYHRRPYLQISRARSGERPGGMVSAESGRARPRRPTKRIVSFLFALLLALPSSVLAQATTANFQTPPLKTQGGTIAEQHDDMVLAIQGLAVLFAQKLASGTEPNDVLHGLYYGLEGQTTTRKDWRTRATAGNEIVFDENTGTDLSPTWVTRLTINSSGITSPPAAHTHASADVVSGQLADARISQSSVEQWSVVTPTAVRIPRANVSGSLENGWISETSVTQHQGAINSGVSIAASQVVSGTFANARISQASVTQYGFLLQSGHAFFNMTGTTCPSGTTEVTDFRNAMIRGTDVAAANGDVPNASGTKCPGGSGCSAAAGAEAYDDDLATGELASHLHPQPNHSHTGPSHTHTGPSHNHTLVHTHDLTLPDHVHTFVFKDVGLGGSGTNIVDDDQTTPDDTYSTDPAGGGVFTSAGASTTTTSSSGTGATGSGGTGSTGLGGNDDTNSTGGNQTHLHPFVTAVLCRVN